MNRQIVDLLESKNIILDKGLSAQEFERIQDVYAVDFPLPLREFLGEILPVSKGFYNWRDFSGSNVAFIKEMMEYPIRYAYQYTDDIDWCEEWGTEPGDKSLRDIEMKKRIHNAPKVIPIFSHRYMPVGNYERFPVLSIHGVDVIYYGMDIEDYLAVEFCEKRRMSKFSYYTKIPFWTDIM